MEISKLKILTSSPSHTLSPLVNGAIAHLPQRQTERDPSVLNWFEGIQSSIALLLMPSNCYFSAPCYEKYHKGKHSSFCRLLQCRTSPSLPMLRLHANAITKSRRDRHTHRRSFSFLTVFCFFFFKRGPANFIRDDTVNHLVSHTEFFLVWTDSSLN